MDHWDITREDDKNKFTVLTYQSDAPDHFFAPVKAGKKWIKWGWFNGQSLIYYDSNKNVECYYPNWVDGQDIKSISRALNIDEFPRLSEFKRVFIPVNDSLLKDYNLDVLKQARQCLFKVYDSPTIDMLQQMVAAVEGDADINCDDLKKQVTPTINGVQLTIVGMLSPQEVREQFFNVDPFNYNSTWMMWTTVWDAVDKEAAFLYKDQEKLELYYLPASTRLRDKIRAEFDYESGIEFVEIPHSPQFKALQVARTCLYREKNSLDATLDELQDMVRRMKNLSDQGRNFKWNKTGVADYCDALYDHGKHSTKHGTKHSTKHSAKQTANSGEWVWAEAQRGRTPIAPKFYFNPKPVRTDGRESAFVAKTYTGDIEL